MRQVTVTRQQRQLPPDTSRKLSASRKEAASLTLREIHCPYCDFLVEKVYSDVTGHKMVYCRNKIERVPIHLKLALTSKEAAEYSNIGINKIDSMLRAPKCPFVLFVGTKKLVKRKEFEQYISSKLVI